jgi:predicted O-methyltransferase YrrM
MKDRIDAILRRQQAEYLDSLLPERDALLVRMEELAAESGHPIADPEVGHLMRMLVRMRRPKRLLEIGTNIGYSVIVLGRELSDDAHLETVEIDRGILTTAKNFVAEADLRCRVTFHEGAALEVLRSISGEFDFVFIDCVKTEYPLYLERLFGHLAAGAVIVADNVLWKGQVAEGPRSEKDVASTAALREFNRRITTDERLISTVLPIGDGVSVSVFGGQPRP